MHLSYHGRQIKTILWIGLCIDEILLKQCLLAEKYISPSRFCSLDSSENYIHGAGHLIYKAELDEFYEMTHFI